MKVILSRKGFDSAAGGYPSPILPDGRLISLPIPSPHSYNDSFHYSDLQLDRNTTYYDLMHDLNPRIVYENRWHMLGTDTECHLDPDIYQNIIKRNEAWKPLFGQIDAAQSHLCKQGVGVGDLFIFFGWFRKVVQRNGKLSFDRSSRDKHVIFGYLQIGEMIKVKPETKIPKWMDYHPHALPSRMRTNNTIYSARDSLTWNSNLPGAGIFSFSKNLVLTKDGLPRSKWCLPEYFKNVRISYHSEDSWKSDYFQSVARGQEFVIDEDYQIENWAKNLCMIK
ncbi:hypothetical protein ACFLUJ_09435 [Chloroflexota bacterium]